MMQEAIMAKMPLVDAVIGTSRLENNLRHLVCLYNAKRPNLAIRAYRFKY
jgi:hypothetical protein